jgi:hypothetical protein
LQSYSHYSRQPVSSQADNSNPTCRDVFIKKKIHSIMRGFFTRIPRCHLYGRWSECRDLNPGPHPPQGCALPGCATSRLYFCNIQYGSVICQDLFFEKLESCIYAGDNKRTTRFDQVGLFTKLLFNKTKYFCTCGTVMLEDSSDGRRDRFGSRFFHAPHRHAHVFRFHDNYHAVRV